MGTIIGYQRSAHLAGGWYAPGVRRLDGIADTTDARSTPSCGERLRSQADQITLDRLQGEAAHGQRYTVAEGSIGSGVSAATLTLSDRSQVVTTVGNRLFLAWWPGSATVTSATLTSASGTTTQPTTSPRYPRLRLDFGQRSDPEHRQRATHRGTTSRTPALLRTPARRVRPTQRPAHRTVHIARLVTRPPVTGVHLPDDQPDLPGCDP